MVQGLKPTLAGRLTKSVVTAISYGCVLVMAFPGRLALKMGEKLIGSVGTNWFYLDIGVVWVSDVASKITV